MESLLGSDALCVKTKDGFYYLLNSWLRQSPHAGDTLNITTANGEKSILAFRRLVKLVRFQQLSLEYIGNVVTTCYFATESALLPFMLRSCLVTREADPEIWALTRGAGLVQPNRGRGDQEWTIRSTLFPADLLPLAQDASVTKSVALVGGYSIQLYINRLIEG